MQITNTEMQSKKYVQIYLTEEELQKKETKDLVQKYKKEQAEESRREDSSSTALQRASKSACDTALWGEQ